MTGSPGGRQDGAMLMASGMGGRQDGAMLMASGMGDGSGVPDRTRPTSR